MTVLSISGKRLAAATAGSQTVDQRLVLGVSVLAVTYNALLAIFAAQGGPASYFTAAGIEILTLLLVLAATFSAGIKNSDAVPFVYLFFTVIAAVFMSMVGETIFLDGIRNVLIITAFTLLGARATERTIRRAFFICMLLTMVFLIVEITSLTTYTSIFAPGEYLEKTRGYIQKAFYEEIGLSLGTIGYEGRFSFGLFEGPRTSSIFLEQVGINCFAIVVLIYLIVLWSKFSKVERYVGVATIFLILVTNNARMASLLSLVMLGGYFVFPKLPKLLLAVIPAVMILSVFVLFQFEAPRRSDDLIGRLGVTYKFLSGLSVQDLLFGNHLLSRRAYDTGYGFVIVSTSIFGALAYWAYLTVIVPQRNAMQRRCAWAVAIYIYAWLLVGGTGSFSMKTASLLWLLVGFVRVQGTDDALPEDRAISPQGRAGHPGRPTHGRG